MLISRCIPDDSMSFLIMEGQIEIEYLQTLTNDNEIEKGK